MKLIGSKIYFNAKRNVNASVTRTIKVSTWEHVIDNIGDYVWNGLVPIVSAIESEMKL